MPRWGAARLDPMSPFSAVTRRTVTVTCSATLWDSGSRAGTEGGRPQRAKRVSHEGAWSLCRGKPLDHWKGNRPAFLRGDKTTTPHLPKAAGNHRVLRLVRSGLDLVPAPWAGCPRPAPPPCSARERRVPEDASTPNMGGWTAGRSPCPPRAPWNSLASLRSGTVLKPHCLSTGRCDVHARGARSLPGGSASCPAAGVHGGHLRRAKPP